MITAQASRSISIWNNDRLNAGARWLRTSRGVNPIESKLQLSKTVPSGRPIVILISICSSLKPVTLTALAVDKNSFESALVPIA